jgi:predicted nucleic acid-binding protein
MTAIKTSAVSARETWILDGNAFVAYTYNLHCHHSRALAWVAARSDARFATCSVTEGTLLRLLMNPKLAGFSAVAAWAILRAFRSRPDHVFIDSGFTYDAVSPTGLRGYKEITDAWIAQLARLYGCRIATFDGGFAARDADVTTLIQ